LVIYSSTSIVTIIYPITCKYRVPVIYSAGTPGNFVVASGSSLVLPWAAADTGGQCSMLRYAGVAEGGAGEEERRRDEGTKEGAKEVARTAGSK
jgi:hypothetical protein